MNVKKTKLALTLTGVLFLSLPISQVFAHEKHCEIKETQLGDTMKYMKSELRGYVKSFKSGDQQKMQQHLTELLTLSERASQYTPVKIEQLSHHDTQVMDNAKMEMAVIEHSKMNMAEMDHSKMDMSVMASMQGMSAEQHHQHMLYIKGMQQLQGLFNKLQKTTDNTQIKTILGKIKTHSKKSHQQFRQDC